MDFRTFDLWLEVLAALLALALAGVVLRSATSRRHVGLLAGLLVAEAGLQASAALSDLWDPAFFGLLVDLGILLWLYLRLLSTLPTPLAHWLRSRGFALVSGILLIGAPLLLAITGVVVLARGAEVEAYFEESPLGIIFPLLFLATGLVSILGPVLAISAWRRAEHGAARTQAGAFAIAFIVRDMLFLGGLAMSEILVDQLSEPARTYADHVSQAMLPGATLLYVPLLAYGILKTQLFDIDLRVKVGISRSTVLTIVAVVSVVVGKLADRFAQANWGWVAGVVTAVLMLFFTRALTKVGDKVAQTAMPHVQATPAYVQFKKLDIYRTAVESALETDGRIDESERRMLDRLATKLGIAAEDRAAVEADLAPPG